MTNAIRFKIKNIRTGQMLPNEFSTKKRARTKADKLDMEYGAINYTIIAVEVAAQNLVA